MLQKHPFHTNFLAIISLLTIAVLIAIPQVGNSEELSDDDLFAAVNKQASSSSRARKLYVFPPGRNKRITFVRTDTHKLYIIDTAEDLVFYLPSVGGVPEKGKRKLDAYRAEFAHVVKNTVQDAVRNHDDKMRAKVVEIFTPKVANIHPKTISDPPPPTLDSYHISYTTLKGKHNFPSDLPLTAKVVVGDNTYSLKTTLQYFSLPNMRVITN